MLSLRYLKSAVLIVITASLVSACTINLGTNSGSKPEIVDTTSPSSSDDLDVEAAWDGVAVEQNSLAQSEIAYTSNGMWGLLAVPQLRLYEYIDGSWTDVGGDGLSVIDPLGSIGLEPGSVDYDITIQSVDLTDDGSVEFIIRHRPAPWAGLDAPNQGRNFGSILSCDAGNCQSLPFWEPPDYGAGGEEHYTVEYIEYIDGTLFASWFGTCGRPCGLLIYQWVSGYSRLEGKEATERQKQEANRLRCIEFEYNFDLPLQLCDEGTPTQLIQDALRGFGFDIESDGYFGEDTQLAVKLYQKSNGIRATGVVDLPTWASLFAGTGLPGNDIDGDGVISPSELSGT